VLAGESAGMCSKSASKGAELSLLGEGADLCSPVRERACVRR
jgi:hypothetical protein